MRRGLLIAVSAVLLLVAPNKSYSGRNNEILDNFYPDDTFTNACGWLDSACGNDGSAYDGCQTNYRYHEIVNCSTNDETYAACQYFNGASWVEVSCSTATVQGGRIRVPVGGS